METNIFETKNYAIGILGEFVCNETGDSYEGYVVEAKGIDCLFIIFEFIGDELVYTMPWNQDNETPEELIDFTYKIAGLIENDVIDIVKFMNKHL